MSTTAAHANNPYIKNQKSKVEWIGESQKNRTIRIRFADICNFNCVYCSEHDTFKDNTRIIDQYQLIELLENLKKFHIIEQRNQNLFIWGGEPTLNNNLIWFIKQIREYYTFIKNIEIHSNLSKKYSDEFFKTLKEYEVSISSSIHLQYQSSIVKDNLYKFNKLNLLKEINLMWHELENFDNCLKIKKEFEELPISIIPTFQLLDKNYSKVKTLLKASKEFIDKSIPTSDGDKHYIEIRNQINTKNMYCNVPKDSFIVNTDGTIYFCQNDFNNKVSVKDINIFIPMDIQDIKNFINGRTHCSYTTCDCEHIILKTEYL